jgi:hypothetical protein
MINAGIETQSETARPISMPTTRLVHCHQGRPKWTSLKFVASAILAASLVCEPGLAGAAGLLDGINGSWSGRGSVTFEGGNSESLSCHAYYTTKGSVLSLAIRCASTSYKTEIRSKLRIADGNLAGEWEERNFNAVGSASGVLSGNTIALRISGAIEGRLTIDQTGGRQSVTISTNGGGLSSVRIGLSKS